jgi:glucosylceramidase
MKSQLAALTLLLFLQACGTSDKAEENKSETQKKAAAAFDAEGKTAIVYTTASQTTDRLTITDTASFAPAQQPVESDISIFINPEKTFQHFIGIGGAITDAAAEVFAKLPLEKQNELLRSYYSQENGIGYSLARTTIHSSDFASGSYTYVADNDKELTSFNIDHDRKHRIPLIKSAIAAAGGNLLLYASPWSPPAFMKDNNNMLKGGKLLQEFNQSWATYFTKFIKAYESEGMPIWGITIQNEPMAIQRWESCIFTAEEERDFLKKYLGPTMQAAGLGDKKIVVWDHNRDLMNHRANVIFADEEASKYAWGIGFHWYETWAGGEPMFANLAAVKESYPDKNILFTEGCVEKFDAEKYQHWPNAERYGRSMINDFNQGTVGWTDWNILLDQTGGPNHVGNFCFAPVHADVAKGELIYTPSYYYIGHFSKFIRPNAKRVSSTSSRSSLSCTSFINEDGSMVTVVMNQTDQEIPYKVYVGSQAIEAKILSHAIQTLVAK